MTFEKILVIQTAFIGDAILITPVIEALAYFYPEAQLDILINKQNQSLFQEGHPRIRKVLTWDKKQQKYQHLRELVQVVRRERYSLVINAHRHASTGLIAALSGAKVKIGFKKNPLSLCYTHKIPHRLEKGGHEVDRNLSLLQPILGQEDRKLFRRTYLYPSSGDYEKVKIFQGQQYICIAPASIWFTKQFPAEKWIELINAVPFQGAIYLLGGKDDADTCQQIISQTNKKVVSLAGQLNLLQSAALMQRAVLNYVNDSAPLHLASSVNAPVCAVFCSTITGFGFYPLSDFSRVVEVQEPLECRPCGSHGHRACPKGHFKCAHDIQIQQLVAPLQQLTS